MRLVLRLAATAVSGVLVMAQVNDAEACGGCFIARASAATTTVTAHRMAFAFSATRTVLWDQIQYAGDPTEFSWVLPVRGDARLEAAEDAWFESLEAITNTRAIPPQLNCFSSNTSSNGGCGCSGLSSDSFPASGGSSPVPESHGVTVTHEGTVGPYQFVALTATNDESLEQWLADNGYVVPPDVQPVVASYLRDGFGFLALKLRPGVGIRQMTPVRVVTPGASPTLPLRMVAAGTGPFVALTLYVIAEGRYEPQGFPAASVDFSKLLWNWSTSETNYSDLRNAALVAGDGTAWLTPFANSQAFTRAYADAVGQPVVFTPVRPTAPGALGPGSFSNLADLYFAQSAIDANTANTCPSLFSTLVTDHPVVDTCRSAPPPAATGDAGAAAGGGIPGADAGRVCDPAPVGSLAARTLECGGFSDVAAALIGMHPSSVWLTRLEANLPHAALAADLTLRPSDKQQAVNSQVRAAIHQNPPCELLENHPEAALTTPAGRARFPVQQAGIGFVSAAALLAARRISRRRRGA